MSDLGFDEIAEFYRYRTPYNKNIFPGIAKELGFDPSTIILDLACGDGPLSFAASGDRCNTGIKSICRGLEPQGLTWLFVEPAGDLI